MKLPTFVTEYLEKQEYKKEYRKHVAEYHQALIIALQNNDLSEADKHQLSSLKQEHSLLDLELKAFHIQECENMFNRMVVDQRISDTEHRSYEDILNYFNLSLEDVHFDRTAFNKYRSLELLERGIFPVIADAKRKLNVIFGNEEVVYFVGSAALRKEKSITTGVHYSGFAASARIIKGFRYKSGVYKVNRIKQDILAVEDTGTFYLTNKSMGFIGRKKQFSFPYGKIHSLELRDIGMCVFKQGRETPYIVTLNDYEVPLTISSMIINKQD